MAMIIINSSTLEVSHNVHALGNSRLICVVTKSGKTSTCVGNG
jgi:hypothetical protein